MAMAGEGESSYRGGAGGKFQKRPHRRPQSTPYDRPKSIVRNPTGREGWLSKLVDPASRFISARAFKIFSNFRKRLTEAKQEPEDGQQEAVPILTDCNGAPEQDITRNGNATNSSEGNGISDLEQMLKQKTFTRSEIDRLTELLHSRKVEFPFRDEEKKNEGNLFQPVSDLKKHVVIRSPLQENRGDSTKSQRNISATGVSSRVLEDDIASPAELAKAYMGSRPSKVSPSMLGVRGQALKEESPLLTNGVFPSKSSALSLVSRSGLRDGNPENGFTTPRSRGRSAIYNMARTPYSRGTASTNYIYGGPSSSTSPQSGWEHNGQFGSKQLALKRRSSALDDESGSVGAIRRIRQKPNLSYHSSSLSARGTDFGYRAGLRHKSSTDKQLLLDDAKNKVSKNGEEYVDDSVAGDKYSRIPSQSSQMASKILQHLEKLTPPQKSSESKLVNARDKSPIKLTPNMLHGQALRSLENVESTKFLQNQDDLLKDSSNVLPDAGGETSTKNIGGENGFKEASIPLKLKASSLGGNSTISSTNVVANINNGDSSASKFLTQPPQVRRAFRMSADEDFPELDDGTYTNGFTSSSGEARKELQTSRSSVPSQIIAVEKTSAKPEFKTPENLTAISNDLKDYGAPVVAKENTGIQSPALVPAVSNFQQDIPIQSASVVNNSVPSRDLNPSSSLSPENISTVPSFTFSSAPPCTESPTSNHISRPDLKRQSFGSDAPQKDPEVDKADVNDKAGSASRPSDNSTSAAAPASTSGFVSSIVSAENSVLNNGLVASSPFSFSSSAPTLASNNSVEKIFGNSSPSVHSSNSATMTTGSTSISDPSISTTLPPSLPSAPASSPPSFFSTPVTSPPSLSSAPAAAPIFSFGSSLTQSSPATTFSSSTSTESSGIKSNDVKETIFGNSNKPPSSGASFAATNAGSNVFGFSSSLTSSSSNSSTTVSSQVPPATGASAVTQSVPFQFGSSGSTTIFGTSGVTSFTPNSSVTDLSGAPPKLFGSGTTFAISATSSPLFSNTPSSTSSSSSSIFSSSWQTNKSPVIGSALSSPSPPPAFSFGAASASGAPTSSAPLVFGQSTGTAGAPTSSAPLVFGQSTGTAGAPTSSAPVVFGQSTGTAGAPTSSVPMMFGQSTGTSSGSLFSFTSATAATSSLPSLSQSQPVFGNANAFRAPGNSGDQMNMEDSMAEDPVQSSAPAAPVFGQPSATPSTPGFMFGSTAPLQLPSPSPSPFQFGGQPNQPIPPNLSPFQASSSQDFNSGGSFSLGSGGGDKGARKTVRVSRIRNRKK